MVTSRQRATPPQARWWHRLGRYAQNWWRYRVWTSCAHRWLLVLDEDAHAGWVCADCPARQR